MTTKQQLEEDFKQALKSKNASVVSTLRMVRAAITNKEIELKKKEEGLSEEETLAIVKSEVKKLKDAIVDFERGDRADLADQNKAEIEILQKYLPEEMGEEEVRVVVKKTIEEMGATSSDIGKVMGRVMGELKGKADGGLVRKAVQEELSEE